MLQSMTKGKKNSFFGNLNLNLKYNHYGKHFDTHSANFNTIEMDSTDLIDLKITKKLNIQYSKILLLIFLLTPITSFKRISGITGTLIYRWIFSNRRCSKNGLFMT